MTRKIFRSIFGACLCVLVTAVIGTAFVLYQSFVDEESALLQNQARIAAHLLDRDGAIDDGMMEMAQMRISIIEPDGTVSHDSRLDVSGMENHADRKEFQEALETGQGFSIRQSNSLSEETYNAAVRLQNGSVLRLSKSRASLFSFLGRAMLLMSGFVILALVLSWWMARSASRRIVAPINAIDPAHPMESCPYEQILPLQKKLADNQKQIAEQMMTLEQKNRQFQILASNMDEGLILARMDGQIVFDNRAAKDLFDLQPEQNLFSLAGLKDLVDESRQKKSARSVYEQDGRAYLLQCSLVESDQRPDGFLILALNITEKEDLARQRAEFTANVTHELKTPLQTILSSSELLLNQMVAAQDVPVFAGYIHTEADRMAGMINDIIHLSRLDSGIQKKNEMIRLDQLIHVIAEELTPGAVVESIAIEEDLEKVSVQGDPADVDDIIRHLLENAIRYNRPKGRVIISLKKEGSMAVLKVCDTGKGIPEAVQERIFERFFTYGKHKGTGLGLAIVRHAVLNMKGTIEVFSKPGQGTCFTVLIPAAES